MKYKLGNKRKVESIYEFPPEIWKEIEESGIDTNDIGDMYIVDILVDTDDLSEIPDDFLINLYRNAIDNEDFDEAELLKNELISRNIDLSDDL